MRKIIELKIEDPVPPEARPIGVVPRLLQPTRPGEPPETAFRFFYDIPVKEDKHHGPTSGRPIQGKGSR